MFFSLKKDTALIENLQKEKDRLLEELEAVKGVSEVALQDVRSQLESVERERDLLRASIAQPGSDEVS